MVRSAFTGLAVVGALATSAAAMPPPVPSSPPFHAEATTLVLAPDDAAEHFCRSAYLISIQATSQNDNANVAVVVVDRNHKSPAPGEWLSVSGFKLAKPVHGRVKVTMTCG